MPRHPSQSPDAFLCIRCGYDLAGLSASHACPECNTPLAGSITAHRPGTPWQRDQTFPAFLATSYQTIRHPTRTLDDMRLDRKLARDLRDIYINFATAIIALAAATLMFAHDTRASLLPRTTNAMVTFLAAALATYMLLSIATFIEYAGLLFLSRRAGTRLLPDTAASIIAHGCVGWLLAAVIVAPSLAVMAFAFPLRVVSVYSVPILVAITGLFAGFMTFELFAYRGLRRLRYANHPKALPPEPPAP